MDNIQCYSRMDTLIVIEHTKNNFLGLKNLCVILFCIKDSISIMTWIFLISHISDLSIKSHQANLSWNSPLWLFVCVCFVNSYQLYSGYMIDFIYRALHSFSTTSLHPCEVLCLKKEKGLSHYLENFEIPRQDSKP